MTPLAKIVLIAVAALGLAACGNRADLRALPGQAAVPVAVGQAAPPTATKLTTPGVAARPARSDEVLRRSEERPADDFDLPPT